MATEAYRDALDAAHARIESLERSRTACIVCEQRHRRWRQAWRTISTLVGALVVAVLAAVVITVTLFVLAFSSMSGPWPGAS